ncbi:MAG: hypothetical protein AB8B52_04430 [Winogradskyella sp.]|uniref:hypothetical protein n=1 Tax=Winogradskyella sp. TaxID=1883156 RepID=UPI00385B1B52
MKFIPTTKDSLALTGVAFIALGFFVAGLFNILDYFMVKLLLYFGLAFMFALVIRYAIKNDSKKNRFEDERQNDSY